MNETQWKSSTETTYYGPSVTIPIRCVKTHSDAQLPVYKHVGPRGDMAADIFAVEDTTVEANSFAKIRTGLIMQPPPGYGLKIRERSGHWFKNQLMIGAGLGDPGYKDEYFIGIQNLSKYPYPIQKGERIAQVQVMRRLEGEFTWVDSVEDTDRSGGLGSTGRL